MWARTIHHEGNIAFADNRSGNGGEMAGSYTFRYGVLHKWRLGIGRRTLRVMAGGAVNTNLGFVYNTRNGNNPANARSRSTSDRQWRSTCLLAHPVISAECQ